MICKFLDASTCYITKQDASLLKRWDVPFTVYPYDEGFFVCCGGIFIDDVPELTEVFGLSMDFINLALYAQANDCWFLRLDCDGDDTLTFPKHEW